MSAEFRIPATAVVATSRSLLLVGQLRTLLDVTEVFGELLDDARKSLDRANSIRSSIRKTSRSMADDARKRALLEATRACSGWAHSFRDAERRIGESFRGMEALLADIGDAGCRATVAHLARVQPPAVKFPGYSPIAWEAETARNLAYRCLFRIRQFLDADTSEPGPDDPEALEGAINLRDGLRCDLTAILHSRDDLDGLEAAIAADLAELNAAADSVEFSVPKSDIEPRRFAELIREAETLRANLIEGAAVYPDGGIYYETDDGVSVALFGLSPAGTSRLQAIAEHLEPVLGTLGADISERGETADGRLLRWAVEMIDRSGEAREFGNPFAFLAVAVARFTGRLQSTQPTSGDQPAAETREAATKPTDTTAPERTPIDTSPSGRVKLYGPGLDVEVDGKRCSIKADEYTLVIKLCRMSKSPAGGCEMADLGKNGRNRFQRLRERDPWKSVLKTAGSRGGRYRIL